MIQDPKALLEIRFMDDFDRNRDRVIGVLMIPKALRDARPLVNLFIEYNLVHPDLQVGHLVGRSDPWAEERAEKWAAARRNYPRRYVYPVETIIPALTADGTMAKDEAGQTPILYHSLYYRADDYKLILNYAPNLASQQKSFRPQKQEVV